MADRRVMAGSGNEGVVADAGGGGLSKEVLALASEVFDRFCAANTLRTILSLHRHLCDLLRIKPTNFPQFYPKIRGRLRSWKAEAIWAKFDKRASHKCYSRGRMCPNTRVFIIGAGPCGLRTAIEAQLLGAKVVVVEKRDRISRNNVLHLWPFVIHDLRALGAKKFFGKFCAGSIDHISIRQLQCILLKCALLVGVEIHEGVSFEGLRPPPEDQSDRIGWRADVLPADHPVAQYEFDVLVGADGKRNTLEGFKRKEFRGKLAIAITVNFINKHTEAEARVQEISGVAFIFRQKFFQEMRASTGIDLENIVYYKDETHYFVMTAKKQSLLAKGVILQDFANTAKLLSPENVDREALLSYAREAANFATEGKLPHLEPAINHHNQPDVAMFDFTSLYAAENASRVVERRGHRLLMLLVGDSLTEPFWPTGSGCARGFLSSMNACWAMRSWGQLGPASIQLPTTPTLRMIESGDEHVANGDGNKENEEGGIVTTPTNKTPKRSVYAILEVLAERESLYRLLGQVAPDNMSRDFDAYTLDPHTRYLSLNTQSVLPYQVRSLYDTDDKSALSFDPPVGPVGGFPSEHSKRRRKRDTQVHPDMLLQWLKRQVALYDGVTVDDMTRSFKDGLALCAVIHRYRPDLLDFHSLNPTEVAHNNQLAFDTLERELGIPPVMTGLEMEQCDVPDKLTMLTYLSQVYDTFRGEIPHIKHPKLQDDVDFLAEEAAAAAEAAALQQARLRKLGNLSQMQKASLITRIVSTSTGKAVPHSLATYVKRSGAPTSPSTAGASPAPSGDRSVGDTSSSSLRRTRKRRSSDKTFGTLSLERMKLQEELARNRLERQHKRQYQRQLATQRFHKSLAMLQANALRAAGSDDEESSPFRDYSILFYRMTAPSFEDRVRDLETKILYPGRRDREARIQAELRKGRSSRGGGGVNDGDFSGRVKNIEDKLKGNAPVEKRPKDLLRAIGKIEKSDWNVRQIERKMEENKMGKGTNAAELLKKSERVPKWNQEKFQDKFMAVERKLMGKAAEQEAQDKYADIDKSLKHYERKLKEGLALESSGPRGANKVSAMAEQFSAKPKDESDAKADEGSADQGAAPLQKSNSRGALVVVPQGGSETCHFCGKRVYLMERLSAEGCFFHRGCFRCEYCSTMLRLGNYAFDRDGKYGSHFFCVQHFGLQGLLNGAVRIGSKSSGKGAAAGGGTKERHHTRVRKSGKDHMHETKANDGKAVEEKENAIRLITTPKGKSPGTGTSGRKSTGEGKRRSKGSKYGTPRIRPPPVVDPVPFLSPPYIPEEEVDLADRGTTPERIEFENSIPVATPDARNAGNTGTEGGSESALGDGGPSKKVSSVEELPQMDEEEWINRNFGASAAEDASDDEDDDSSSFSNDEAGENVEIGGIADLGEEVMERRRHSKKGEKERDNDEDEVFVEAMEEPMMTIEQTRLIAEKWKRRYSKDVVEDGGRSGESKATGGEAQNGKTNKEDDEESSDSYESGESDDYEDEDEDEDSETATEGDEEEEGEEEAKARELRKQEFHLKVPQRPPRTGHGSGGDQGSDTEVNLKSVCSLDIPLFCDLTDDASSTELSTDFPPPAVASDQESDPQPENSLSLGNSISDHKSDVETKSKKSVATLKSEFFNTPSMSLLTEKQFPLHLSSESKVIKSPQENHLTLVTNDTEKLSSQNKICDLMPPKAAVSDVNSDFVLLNETSNSKNIPFSNMNQCKDDLCPNTKDVGDNSNQGSNLEVISRFKNKKTEPSSIALPAHSLLNVSLSKEPVKVTSEKNRDVPSSDQNATIESCGINERSDRNVPPKIVPEPNFKSLDVLVPQSNSDVSPKIQATKTKIYSSETTTQPILDLPNLKGHNVIPSPQECDVSSSSKINNFYSSKVHEAQEHKIPTEIISKSKPNDPVLSDKGSIIQKFQMKKDDIHVLKPKDIDDAASLTKNSRFKKEIGEAPSLSLSTHPATSTFESMEFCKSDKNEVNLSSSERTSESGLSKTVDMPDLNVPPKIMPRSKITEADDRTSRIYSDLSQKILENETDVSGVIKALKPKDTDEPASLTKNFRFKKEIGESPSLNKVFNAIEDSSKAAPLTKVSEWKEETSEAASLTKVPKSKEETAKASSISKVPKSKGEACEVASLTKEAKSKEETAKASSISKMPKSKEEALGAASLTKEAKSKEETAKTASLTKVSISKEETDEVASLAKVSKSKEETAKASLSVVPKSKEGTGKAASPPKVPESKEETSASASLTKVPKSKEETAKTASLTKVSESKEETDEVASLAKVPESKEETDKASSLTKEAKSKEETGKGASLPKVPESKEETSESASLTKVPKSKDEARGAASLTEVPESKEETGKAASLSEVSNSKETCEAISPSKVNVMTRNHVSKSDDSSSKGDTSKVVEVSSPSQSQVSDRPRRAMIKERMYSLDETPRYPSLPERRLSAVQLLEKHRKSSFVPTTSQSTYVPTSSRSSYIPSSTRSSYVPMTTRSTYIPTATHLRSFHIPSTSSRISSVPPRISSLTSYHPKSSSSSSHSHKERCSIS